MALWIRFSLSLLAGFTVVLPEDARTPAIAPAAGSVQQQIDELKAGQARMLNELAELKRLLAERPTRFDTPIRSAPGASRWSGNPPVVSSTNIVSVDVQGEPFRGDRLARVAIMEYSDFDCSYCARYVREIYPQIQKLYIGTGKALYYFRDLPGPGEPKAMLKARAARCAGEQGKFWEMHDRLFASQADPDGQDPAAHAASLGLDGDKFAACLASDRYAENIRLSIQGAKQVGIYGTPAFLIGAMSEDGNFIKATKLIVGGESIAPIQETLDALLAPPSGK